MADNKSIVTKIYKVSIEGAENVVTRMADINTKIDKYKIAIQQAKKEKLTNPEDLKAQEQLNITIAEGEAEVKRLTAERKLATKELQAYVDSQKKAVDQQVKESNSVKGLPGSYKALYDEYKKLNTELRNTPNTAPQFEALKAQVTGLKSKVDDFNRQFTKDGTLVGEYTTGILKAFKTAGLDDLIKNQGQLIRGELNKLDKEFVDIQKELSNIGVSSDGSFHLLEQHLIENRQQAQKLESQLETVNVSLKGVGGIGTQVTDSLGKNFKGLVGNIAGMVTGLFAFQAGLSFIKDSVSEFDQAETNTIRLQNALKNFGKEKYFDELKKQADELAEKLGFIDNDDIIKAQEKLVTFNKLTTEQIKEAIPTIIDLASNLGVSIPEATSIFIKGIEGSGKALKEYGIDIKEGGTESERFTILQTELAQKVAGSAQAMSESASGGARKFKQVIADLKEDLGAKLLPILVAVGSGLLALPLGSILTILTVLTTGFIVYRAQLTLTAFQQGVLTKESLAYYLLSKLQAVQIAIVTGLQQAQNFILATYTALTIRATAATGASAVALRGLAAAFRFLTGPFGIALTLIIGLTTAFGVMSAKASSATQAVSENVLRQQALVEVQRQSLLIYTDQISKINSWVSVIKSATTSADTKRHAVEELTKINRSFGDVMKDNVIDLNKLDAAYKAVTEAIIAQANAQASSNITAQKQQKLVNLSTARQLVEQSLATSGGFSERTGHSDVPKEILDIIKDTDGAETIINLDLSKFINVTQENRVKFLKALTVKEEQARAEFIRFDKIRQDSQKAADAITNKTGPTKVETVFDTFSRLIKNGGTEADFEQLKRDIDSQKAKFNVLSAEYKKLVQLGKDLEEFVNPKDKKDPAASKLTTTQQDAIKNIDAERDQRLAAEKTKFSLLQETEIVYLTNVLRINEEAADKKLALLTGKNAEEKKEIAELNLFKIDQQIETNQKIFDIESKRLKDNFELAKQGLQDNLDKVNSDPKSDDLDKTRAKIAYFSGLLELETKYDKDQQKLESDYKLKSVASEKDRAKQIRDTRQGLNDENYREQKLAYEKELRLLQEANQRQQDEIKANAADQSIKVLQNDNLTPNQKAVELKKIEVNSTKALLATQVADAKIAYEKLQEAAKKNLATETQLSAAKVKLKTAELALVQYSANQEISFIEKLNNTLKGALKNLTDFFKGIKATQQQIGDAIQAALQSVQQAISEAQKNYFEGQRQRVDEERDQTFKRIDAQERLVLSTAQSEAEKEDIKKRFDKEREQADIKAGEQKKKIAKTELAINYAVAVVKTLAAYAFPYSLLAVAGLTALYFVQRANLDKQKFEKGGVPTKTGGRITGPSHAQGGVPFNYEAEGDELAIINKKSARSNKRYTVTGTPIEIASAINEVGGGVRFKVGAKVHRLASGGMIGANVQAPIFSPAATDNEAKQAVNKGVSENLQAHAASMEAIVAISRRIDNLQVTLNPNEVRQENKKFIKQTDIATL